MNFNEACEHTLSALEEKPMRPHELSLKLNVPITQVYAALEWLEKHGQIEPSPGASLVGVPRGYFRTKGWKEPVNEPTVTTNKGADMKYQVKHMREINYFNMSEDERKKIWRLNDLYMQQICTCFDEEDNYFALYVDTDVDTKGGCDNDDRAYAVYMHKSGELICLLSDAGSCLNGFQDHEYGYERNELYRQIALLAGWPEKLPPKKRYTVRINRIMDVEVRADNKEQADVIGRNIAFLANHVNGAYGALIRSAMADCEYEFADSWDAPAENDGVWDLSLADYECEAILNLED